MLLVKVLRDGRVSAPRYKTVGSAGADLYNPSEVVCHPGEITSWDLGLRVAIPEGYEGQLRLRSSWGLRGLIIPQGVGTIDSDYRGVLRGVVWNLTKKAIHIDRHSRVFQLVISPVVQAEFVNLSPEDPDWPATERGSGGFGSTGEN